MKKLALILILVALPLVSDSQQTQSQPIEIKLTAQKIVNVRWTDPKDTRTLQQLYGQMYKAMLDKRVVAAFKDYDLKIEEN